VAGPKVKSPITGVSFSSVLFYRLPVVVERKGRGKGPSGCEEEVTKGGHGSVAIFVLGFGVVGGGLFFWGGWGFVLWGGGMVFLFLGVCLLCVGGDSSRPGRGRATGGAQSWWNDRMPSFL